jgi:hypothetical protein
MIATPFTPFALKPRYHVAFAVLCVLIFAVMFLLERDIDRVYWAGGLFLGAVGGLLQIWSVEEVIHSRKARPSWKEFLSLVWGTRWGKGYFVYLAGYLSLVFYLGGRHGGNLWENVMADYLSFIFAKELVTLPEREKLRKAFSFKERRFDWARLPRYRERPWRRFVRRWLKFY